MLISLLFANLTVFSQTDTSTNTKTFPIPVVRLIMKDLLIGDSAKLLLSLTEKQLVETEKKVAVKDSIITTLRAKELNYTTTIDAERKKNDMFVAYTKLLEDDLKRERVKRKFWSIVDGSAILALILILIAK